MIKKLSLPLLRRNTMLKRSISVCFSVLFLLLTLCAPVNAAMTSEEDVVTPRYTHFAVVSINLSIDSLGCATATGTIQGRPGVTTGIKAVLQKYNSSNGTWSDIKTFNSSSTSFNCVLSGSYYVARGTYRVYAEFYAFNNTGVCVEIASGYSPIKDY